MTQPIDVAITVDVEFDINAAVTDPAREPIGAERVYARVGGVSHGLGFVLEALAEYGLRATFFTEMFNVYRFGDAPMAGIVADMARHGQDIQLHLHPVWRYWHSPPRVGSPDERPRPNDLFVGRDPHEVRDWIQDGVTIFTRLVGHRPIAFRVGSLWVDEPLYGALRDTGFSLASNVGLGWVQPRESSLHLCGGIHDIAGVIEIPVTTYADFGYMARLRLLTITGSSFAEARSVLEASARCGFGPVVLLTHPHDFATTVLPAGTEVCQSTPHPLQQRRFRHLCRYLHDHRDRFRTLTFAEAASRWATAPKGDSRLVHASLGGLVARFVENKLLGAMRHA